MTERRKEIYVSIDIEADGPIPAQNSMLNFGAAAFDLTADNPLEPIDTFEVNLVPLRDAVQDKSTMAWWKKQPEAWERVNHAPVAPKLAIRSFLQWTWGLGGSPVMVVYPAYDFMWMHYYIMRFGGVQRSPYSFAALDVKTLSMIALKENSYKACSKRKMAQQRRNWFQGQPKHNHTGLADAIGQGMLFVNIMQELRGQ